MSILAKRKERRHSPRINLPCRLRYLKIPKQAVGYCDATIQDISQGGFRFRTNELFRRRSCFLLDLYLPGADPIRSLATVAWIKAMPGDDGFQIGGTFIEPNLDVGTALARLDSSR